MRLEYGSDIIVEMLKLYGFKHCLLNPGNTTRGIIDSILSDPEQAIEVIEAPHEKIAVGMAHGYAKVTGQPACVILHNVVGLLHGTLGIYYAYLDRAPMVVLGGTGPMAASLRRPRVDWDHTALVQGNAVRDFVKWDDQPFGPHSFVDAIARGYRVATTEPAGPVYLCFDLADQEAKLEYLPTLPDPNRPLTYSPMQADPAALARASALLTEAKRPVIITDYLGPAASESLAALAETLGAPVVNLYGRLSLPTTHPLHLSDLGVVQEADVIVALDVRDLYGCLVEVDPHSGQSKPRVSAGCRLIDVGPGDVAIKSWSAGYQRFVQTDVAILADAEAALPHLVAAVRRLGGIGEEERQARLSYWSGRREAIRRRWQAKAREDWDASGPMTTARLASEIWDAIRQKDWVLTAGSLNRWALHLWDFDQLYRYPGKQLGTATQIGISLGVALAHKGSGRLVVDIQPDGDLMFDASALYVAAHHKIPMLVVMYNNRGYVNTMEHQRQVANDRGRPTDRIHIGQKIADPPPDFATVARGFGWYAEGPIADPSEVAAALQRAIRVVEEEGRPALVDCITRNR